MQTIPDLTIVQRKIQVYDGAKAILIRWKVHFEFCSFPKSAMCVSMLPRDAGRRRQAAASPQAHSHEGKRLVLSAAQCSQRLGDAVL